MNKAFAFFAVVFSVCGLFYFQKTKTQKENQMRVAEVITLKDECEEKLKDISGQKQNLSSKLDSLKQEIDKNNEELSKNDNTIKNLSKNPRNKKSVEDLKNKNIQLKEDIAAKNIEIENLTNQLDACADKESLLIEWKQHAFEVLGKTQTGNLSNDDKAKLSAVSEEYKNIKTELETPNIVNNEENNATQVEGNKDATTADDKK